MLKEIIEKLTGIHIHNWKYSNYEYFRCYYGPDTKLPTKRECRCSKKQKQVFGYNQEGEMWYSEWVNE